VATGAGNAAPWSLACLALLGAVEDSNDRDLAIIRVDGIDHNVWQTGHHPFIRARSPSYMTYVRKPAEPFHAFENPINH
jgi:hypothetical protein